MAKIIQTDTLSPATSGEEAYYIYNGLDCCLTHEVFENMPWHDYAQASYDFERELQGPYLGMMLNGFPANPDLMKQLETKILAQMDKVRNQFERITLAAFGKAYSVSAPKQHCKIFYDLMKLPVQYKTDKKTREKKPSAAREALEKLILYLYAKPLILHILEYRELSKKKDILSLKVDNDGRLRCSYNIAGTETWRPSSSENAFGGGTNFQNIEPALRIIFSAPAGYKFCNIDGEQAESRLVGALCLQLFNVSTYLDACESSDLHSLVAKMVWPNLAWGTAPDRAIAEQPFYRHFSYRDMAKRGGHGTNYYGQPYTMAKHLQVDQKLMEDFQHNYFKAFPEIRQYHTYVSAQLNSVGYLDNLYGFRRYFLGRRYDDSTLREGIAHIPQSTIGIMTNKGLLNIWRNAPEVQVLHNNFDSVVVMYKEEIEDQVVPKLLKLFEQPIEIRGRKIVIPAKAEVGWNWAKYAPLNHKDKGLKALGIDSNLDGLKTFKGHDDRKRTQAPISHQRFY